ncbi:MAG TPA: hypothetical protein VHR66_00215 [Gemmataceae bacterium]|jgi:hypothetical protein|nr:hypothetical protein [Gemmataceae bacterium]
MRRRRLLISIGLVLGFVATILIGLVVMVKSEPSFYTQAEMPPGQERTDMSTAAMAQYSRILGVLDDPHWEIKFTGQQLNAFFQEQYYQVGGDENLPDDCHAPRVKIEDGKMRIGFRWGTGTLSTVASAEIKFWKVPQGVNTLAMEIVSLQAGALPIPKSFFLDKISEKARRENIEISWYRKDGHPVAVMRFQADLTRPTFQFDRIELAGGELRMTGRSTDLLGPPIPRVTPKQ